MSGGVYLDFVFGARRNPVYELARPLRHGSLVRELVTPLAQGSPFLASLSDDEVAKALAELKQAVADRRSQLEALASECTRLSREYLGLEQEALRRRPLLTLTA